MNFEDADKFAVLPESNEMKALSSRISPSGLTWKTTNSVMILFGVFLMAFLSESVLPIRSHRNLRGGGRSRGHA